ncbi:uncharacterized protein LOC120645075 [Panicum virgatum]|uniref:uncharacterized protein LOC120645075 n=1 Tax=Panicum virgatum TaxID=38727 RepID=UPI0019D64DB6|nr:uncharacterized protein LOC120645075 [Panicum virgatum]
MEDLIIDGSPEETLPKDVVPLAAYHPDIGVVNLDGQLQQGSEEVSKVDMCSGAAILLDSTNKSHSSIGVQGAQDIQADQDSQASGVASPGQPESIAVPTGKVLVHNQEGVYFMDAAKWPSLDINDASQDPILTQEEDIMDFSTQLEEPTDEEDSQEWEIQKRKKKSGRQIKKRFPAVATRTSARVPRDGVPIAAKAIARAQKRNETMQEMAAVAGRS